ncbi:hypothetical protein LJR168_001387 [Pseudoxanthomonas sp. LjRoot168]|uniref:hypothetical protein n=1 Tax=unclassified Pseudoxanthomonas TaxID=2645906 RepID=UPI003ECE85D7
MRQRIELWKRVFDTDDNAISKALSKLTWDLGAFSCVVEMVRQAPMPTTASGSMAWCWKCSFRASGAPPCKAFGDWPSAKPSTANVECAPWVGY